MEKVQEIYKKLDDMDLSMLARNVINSSDQGGILLFDGLDEADVEMLCEEIVNDYILEVDQIEKKVINVIPKKKTFEIVIKNLKDTDGCFGCKHINDSIEMCKLKDCWIAIEPKEAYEDK